MCEYPGFSSELGCRVRVSPTSIDRLTWDENTTRVVEFSSVCCWELKKKQKKQIQTFQLDGAHLDETLLQWLQAAALCWVSSPWKPFCSQSCCLWGSEVPGLYACFSSPPLSKRGFVCSWFTCQGLSPPSGTRLSGGWEARNALLALSLLVDKVPRKCARASSSSSSSSYFFIESFQYF